MLLLLHQYGCIGMASTAQPVRRVMRPACCTDGGSLTDVRSSQSLAGLVAGQDRLWCIAAADLCLHAYLTCCPVHAECMDLHRCCTCLITLQSTSL